MPPKSAQHSGEKQAAKLGAGRGGNVPPVAHRFKKGQSGNPNGRPKSFDALRQLAQEIAHEQISRDGKERMRAEDILRQWSLSREPQLQIKFFEYAFGKVPDKLETDQLLSPIVIMRHAHESQNGSNGNGDRKK